MIFYVAVVVLVLVSHALYLRNWAKASPRTPQEVRGMMIRTLLLLGVCVGFVVYGSLLEEAVKICPEPGGIPTSCVIKAWNS